MSLTSTVTVATDLSCSPVKLKSPPRELIHSRYFIVIQTGRPVATALSLFRDTWNAVSFDQLVSVWPYAKVMSP